MKMFGAVGPSEIGKIIAEVCDGGSVQYHVPTPPVVDPPKTIRRDATLLDALLIDPPLGGWDSEGEYHYGITTNRRPAKGEACDLPDHDRLMQQIERDRVEGRFNSDEAISG